MRRVFLWLGVMAVLAIGSLPLTAQESDSDCPTDTFSDVASYAQTQNYAQPTLNVTCCEAF